MNTKTPNINSLIELLERIGALPKGTGEHSHKCPKCGHIWSHEDSCVNDKPAHTCKCGVETWYIYHDKREGIWQSCGVAR